MNAGFNRPNTATHDNYNTSKSAYEMLKQYIPDDTTLYDPFYNDGKAFDYMTETFSNNIIIHEDKDAFSWFPECDIVVTNPPFSRKYEVLEWLVKHEKPFFCLLPLYTISTIKYSKITNFKDFQYIVSCGRIKYEADGIKTGACFESVWICHKINLPKDVMFHVY
jgi:hypothetical protein